MLKKDFEEFSKGVDLLNRRLLNLEQFRAYAGDLRETTAKQFLKANPGLTKQIGNKVLIDRILFDSWCDKGVKIQDTITPQTNIFPKCSKRR